VPTPFSRAAAIDCSFTVWSATWQVALIVVTLPVNLMEEVPDAISPSL
jgi:hypothetical protein